VIVRLLAKNPADRCASAAETDAALAACQATADWTDLDAARWWSPADAPASGLANDTPHPNGQTAGA
jgi:hypothetical protein